MFGTMIVRVNKREVKVYRIDDLRPELGNPLTLTVLLVNKYFDIKRHWVIDKLKVFSGLGGYDLYPIDKEPDKTVGDVLDSATSYDIGDLEVIPKAEITEEVIDWEAI